MNIVLHLKVEVDSSRVPSSDHHEVFNFSVSELRSHCDGVSRVYDKINKENMRSSSVNNNKKNLNFQDSPGGGIAMI